MTKHIPVLLKEVVDSLKVTNEMVVVDCTLGGGGHSLEIINRMENGEWKIESLRMVCIDQDQNAVSKFKEKLVKEGFSVDGEKFVKGSIAVFVLNSNFVNLRELLNNLNIAEVNGLIADLGISTDQLEDEQRGFSYNTGGDLDLRMDLNLGVKASDLLNMLSEKQIEGMLRDMGDVSEARYIAKEVLKFRNEKPIKTVKDMLEIINKAVRSKYSRRLYARVFQALRITVNSELLSLKDSLPQAFDSLTHGGTVSIITFHSGEDRLVKRFFKEKEEQNLGESKLVYPTEKELRENSKSTSAKLRIFYKH